MNFCLSKRHSRKRDLQYTTNEGLTLDYRKDSNKSIKTTQEKKALHKTQQNDPKIST